MSFKILSTIIISYLIGSVSFSYILVKEIKNIDVRDIGTGNAGARNAARAIGAKYGFLIGLLDVGKGAIPIIVILKLGFTGFVVLFAACALVIGHNWPVYYGFKGGNG
ncbi:MAG: glycerol-3-phosphate acyltransferase, partial [Atribacterota bacterium]